MAPSPPTSQAAPASRLTRREEETKNERAASGGEGGVKKKKNSMHLSSTHLLLSPSHPSLSPPTTSATHKRNHQHPKEPKTNSAPRKPWMLRAPDVASGSRLLVLLKLSQLRLPLLPPPLLLLLLLGQVQVQVPVPVLEVVRVEQVQMAVGGDEWRQERVL